MYILNIASTIKKIPVNEIRDFIFENYYKKIRFSKEIIKQLVFNETSEKKDVQSK